MADWIEKQDPTTCCLQETHLWAKDTYRLKVRGWEKIFHANRQNRKAGVATLISGKTDFKTKAVKKDKGQYFFFFSLFAISWATAAAYGGSQARGPIGAVATSLRQSHSNAGSEPRLQPTPQLTAMPDR